MKWTAGWNMPGYTDPSPDFDTWEDARAYLEDELRFELDHDDEEPAITFEDALEALEQAPSNEPFVVTAGLYEYWIHGWSHRQEDAE